jgi:hypothetical protein
VAYGSEDVVEEVAVCAEESDAKRLAIFLDGEKERNRKRARNNALSERDNRRHTALHNSRVRTRTRLSERSAESGRRRQETLRSCVEIPTASQLRDDGVSTVVRRERWGRTLSCKSACIGPSDFSHMLRKSLTSVRVKNQMRLATTTVAITAR